MILLDVGNNLVCRHNATDNQTPERHSGMTRERQTRNRENPGSMPSHRPGTTVHCEVVLTIFCQSAVAEHINGALPDRKVGSALRGFEAERYHERAPCRHGQPRPCQPSVPDTSPSSAPARPRKSRRPAEPRSTSPPDAGQTDRGVSPALRRASIPPTCRNRFRASGRRPCSLTTEAEGHRARDPWSGVHGQANYRQSRSRTRSCDRD